MEKICDNCCLGRKIVGVIDATEKWKEEHRLCYCTNMYVHKDNICKRFERVEEEEDEE